MFIYLHLCPRTVNAKLEQIGVLICLQVGVHGDFSSILYYSSYIIQPCQCDSEIISRLITTFRVRLYQWSVPAVSLPASSDGLKANYQSLGRVVLSITRPPVPRYCGVLLSVARLDKDLRMRRNDVCQWFYSRIGSSVSFSL